MSQDLPTVSSVDIQRYAGNWYEIARKPMRHEDATAQDITATYRLNADGSVQVLNGCINEDGQVEVSEGKASAVDPSNAKLEVTFLPEGLRWIPFTKGDYWILKLDESYSTALVGEPNRKYLWLLHRQPQLDPAIKAEWLQFAQSLGYELDDIIQPVQSGRVHQEG